jgi:hypothetical protein
MILCTERERDLPLLDLLESGLERPARRQRPSTPPRKFVQFDQAADSIRLDTQARLAHQELHAEGLQRLLDTHAQALHASHARILALEAAFHLRGDQPPPPPQEPTNGSSQGSNVLGPTLQEQLDTKTREADILRARLERALQQQARAAAASSRPYAADARQPRLCSSPLRRLPDRRPAPCFPASPPRPTSRCTGGTCSSTRPRLSTAAKIGRSAVCSPCPARATSLRTARPQERTGFLLRGLLTPSRPALPSWAA